MLIKAELHCHSNYSGFRIGFFPWLYDSTMTVEQIIEVAIVRGIGILAITDHDSIEGSLYAEKLVSENNLPLLIIPSLEVTSKDGHILAYNVRENIPARRSAIETIERIHDVGGFAVAAHPTIPLVGCGKKITGLGFDAIEGFNATMPSVINRAAQRIANVLHLPWIAASDAHHVPDIGHGQTLFEDKIESPNDLVNAILNRRFTTHGTHTSTRSVIRNYFKYSAAPMVK